MDFTGVVKPLVQQMIFKIPKNSHPGLNQIFCTECKSKRMLILAFFFFFAKCIMSSLLSLLRRKILLIETPSQKLGVTGNSVSHD